MDIGKGVQEGLNQTSAAQKVGTLSSIEQKRSQEMIEKSGETEKIPKSSTIVTTVAPAATIVNKPTENHIAPEKNSKKKLGIDESNNITNNDSNIDRSSNNSSTSASSNSRTTPTSITTTTSTTFWGRSALLASLRSHSDEGFLPHICGGNYLYKESSALPNPSFPALVG